MNDKLVAALNKLARWRTVFASWQLGLRPSDEPELRAVKDHREVTMFLRAEGNALVQLLVEKGVFTKEEWDAQMVTEAQLLDKVYEERFPGFKTTDWGLQVTNPAAQETMKSWRRSC